MVITKDSESFDPGSSPGRTSRFFGFFLCSPKPIKPREQFQGLRVHSSAVEHGIADPGVAGSIPAAPFSIFFFRGANGVPANALIVSKLPSRRCGALV